jgi:cytoskeletal protein RodZ
MDIGTELRQARDRKGLSSTQLAEKTKINVATLRAIENHDIDKLPGGIFTSGFVKAYAREVGLDPAEALRRFIEETEASQPEAEDAVQTEGADAHRQVDALNPIDWRIFTAGRIGIAAIVLLTLYLGFSDREPSSDAPQPDSTESAETASSSLGATANAPPDLDETATSGALDASGSSPAAGAPLRVVIHPTGPCWITAGADGARVSYELAAGGEHYPIEAQHEVTLRLGDAATCAFSINGIEARRLGEPGQVVDLTITPDNYRDFVNQ